MRHLGSARRTAGPAWSLFLSEGTVISHVRHVRCQLGATNRAQAVSRYLRPAGDTGADGRKEMIPPCPKVTP